MTTDRSGYSISATNPGTEQAAESAAALAAASIAFQPTDVAYAQLCLSHSKSVRDKLDALGGSCTHGAVRWRSIESSLHFHLHQKKINLTVKLNHHY